MYRKAFSLLSLSEQSESAVFDQDSGRLTDSAISDLDLTRLTQPSKSLLLQTCNAIMGSGAPENQQMIAERPACFLSAAQFIITIKKIKTRCSRSCTHAPAHVVETRLSGADKRIELCCCSDSGVFPFWEPWSSHLCFFISPLLHQWCRLFLSERVSPPSPPPTPSESCC